MYRIKTLEEFGIRPTYWNSDGEMDYLFGREISEELYNIILNTSIHEYAKVIAPITGEVTSNTGRRQYDEFGNRTSWSLRCGDVIEETLIEF